MTEIHGRILTETGWVTGRVVVDGDRIADVIPGEIDADRIVLPGFIDLHCHGGGGADVMDGGNAVRTVAALHARHGTTAFLATTMTAPVGEIEGALVAIAAGMEEPRAGEAAILGVHLEGPFISPDRLGAQPPFAIRADLDLMRRFFDLAPILVVTWAPEADPDGALRAFLGERGIRVQIGHSNASYEVAAAALADGVDGVTHVFNGMSPLHHRHPGVTGAALAHAQRAEMIPDLVHVHPGALLVALRAIPDVYAVTDATAASGMPDGDYRLGRQPVRRCENSVRLADGSLAGSALTMDVALRNLVDIGLPLDEASRRTSTIAADYLGLADRGRIRHGATADLVILDTDLQLRDVYVAGTRIDRG